MRNVRPIAVRRISAIALLMLLCPAGVGRAAVWQWAVPVRGVVDPKDGQSRALLWIPPNCEHVRATIVGQFNMEEYPILTNARFRDAMSKLGVAEVWATPAFDLFFRFDRGAAEHFTQMMNDLADESGYQELKTAPIIPIGHSAAASYPWNFGACFPQRTLAAISVSGQWPYYKDTNTPDWGNRNVDFVPGLVTMGEYEAAESRAGDGLPQRVAHPNTPLSMLQCPGEGHFAPTQKKIDYLTLYISKAIQYRLDESAGTDFPAKLKGIDPSSTGWLADRWHSNAAPSAPAAPVGQYTGDPKQAFWFFDEELARATEAYESGPRGKVDLLGYVQDGKVVQQTNTHQQVNLRFEPLEDGITFKLKAVFVDTVPGGSPRPATWTGLPAGSPIGHASNPEAISVDPIAGPVIKLSADTFQVCFNESGMDELRRNSEIWLAATHPGDGQYKPMVQQSLMHIPPKHTRGVAQHITFGPLADETPTSGPVKLTATSDANVPVSFSVLAGPAEINGDMLTLTPIPPKAKFPVKVTVFAWQYGHEGASLLQSAEPVARSFLINQ